MLENDFFITNPLCKFCYFMIMLGIYYNSLIHVLSSKLKNRKVIIEYYSRKNTFEKVVTYAIDQYGTLPNCL